MASRLLARLDAQIARTRQPLQHACLRAQRAGLLGRHGQTGLARTQLRDIRRAFEVQPHVAVSAWVALAEGQVDDHEDLCGSPHAHDRFNRAYALSRAARLTPLQALSAAWLGHSEQLRHHPEGMSMRCAEALTLAASDDHAARWRAALTVAVAYHSADRLDRAQPWYADARQHAMADGDEVAVSALLRSQVSLRVRSARLAADVEDRNGSSSPALAIVMGAESTDRFDAVMGLQSLSGPVSTLRAQVLLLQGAWDEALAVMDEPVPGLPADRPQRQLPWAQADRAWCLLQAGRHNEARTQALLAQRALQGAGDLADRAVAQARLSQLWTRLGDPAAAEHWQRCAQEAVDAHRAQQGELAALLDRSVGALAP